MFLHFLLLFQLIYIYRQTIAFPWNLAESSHQPARLGKILNQALVDKDRREAPHERNLQFKKPKK